MTRIEKQNIYNALTIYADIMAKQEREHRERGETAAAVEAMIEKSTALGTMTYWREIIEAPCGTVTI